MTIDQVTHNLLEKMVPTGLLGRNKSEVASWIIREWIWHNPDALARIGISVKSEMMKGKQK